MKDSTSLEDKLDSNFAEAWRPQPGETLIGEVTDISEREGAYGRYPIVTVRTDDGEEVAVHAFRTVLASRLAEEQPKIGERIGIRYEGERAGAERKYHSYKVVVDRPERKLDWSAYAEDGAPADPPASDIPVDTAGLEESQAAVRGKAEGDDIPF